MLQLVQLIPGLESQSENVSADLLVRFMCGGLAGITAATVTYPLDLVRTRLAAQVSIDIPCNFLSVVIGCECMANDSCSFQISSIAFNVFLKEDVNVCLWFAQLLLLSCSFSASLSIQPYALLSSS